MEELEASNRSLKEQVHQLEERVSKLQMVGRVGWGRVGEAQGVSHCFLLCLQEVEEERQRASAAQKDLRVSPLTPVAQCVACTS